MLHIDATGSIVRDEMFGSMEILNPGIELRFWDIPEHYILQSNYPHTRMITFVSFPAYKPNLNGEEMSNVVALFKVKKR
jgi:hypothetical protein